MRDFQTPGRSVVYGTGGAAATSHPLATLAAIEVLRSGGNAVDAAITACALQGVIEPQSTGIGGDCFAFIWRADERRLHAFNGSGWSPAGLTPARLSGEPAVSPDSIHAVTVPGAIDAWDRLLRAHGTRSLADILAPSIEAAERGFVVHARVAQDWAMEVPRLARDPGAAAQYLFDGAAPKPGDVVRLPILARTLRRLADGGRDAFYAGDIARDMVASLQALGGMHELEDFAALSGRPVTPISLDYRGVEVFQIPPNGQGITALLMLGLLRGFDHAGLDPAGVDRYHLQIEAARLAYGLRDAVVADPDHAEVPVDRLLSDAFLDGLRDRIDPRQAGPDIDPALMIRQRDTVYVTVVDRDRNCCSLINSVFHSFGSGKVCPRTGVVFQNRGSGFVLAEGHPNQLAPRKRPLHTIIPGFAMRDGAPLLSFGVMGGIYQPIGQVQVLQNIVDFGMDVQQAIDHPRGMRCDGAFEAETGIPETVLAGLVARGHAVRRAEEPWGGGQAILLAQGGAVLAAGSDPRKDGNAIAY